MGPFTAPALRRDPFSRSYGVRLPSSLTRFLSRALVYLYPPTCVGFGTVSGSIPRGFSRRPSIGGSPAIAGRLDHVSGAWRADLPARRPTHLKGRPSALP